MQVLSRYRSLFPKRKNSTMSINQLVYVSQATRKMSPADLAAIQDTAKNNNAPLDVTGSLFYNGGWFLQVLEGPVSTLDELYQKIELDPRHKNSPTNTMNWWRCWKLRKPTGASARRPRQWPY
jgi:hypothetical protein